jgi:outer membrane protein OmpA-like peptidoglycan-associated protein
MKRILCLCIAVFFSSAGVVAQNMTMELEDSLNLKKNQYDSQYDYENMLSPFPPKKKNNWAVGFGVGSPMILGDVKSYLLGSYGADLKIRKALSHVFSLRWQSIFSEIRGIDFSNGVTSPDNHKTRMTDNTLQAVFTLNNIKFHQKKSKLGVNLFLGGGFASSFTQFNLLDGNSNAYDYSGLSNVETFGDRRFSSNEISNMLDDGFETTATIADGDASINSTRILPSIVMGMGFDIYLSKRIDLALETRLSRHFTDDLDGFNVGNGEDWFMYSSIGMNFKIGKREEPLYWQNALDAPYQRIMALEQVADPTTSFQDGDQDGVLDIFDKDLNTFFGVEVNTQGVDLDSDRDGVPNFRDKELNSPDGARVDVNGFAIDTDKDGVPDIKDLDNNTLANAMVDVNGREVNGGSSGGSVLYMRGVDIWSIFFDSDDFNVKTEYHAIILNLASFMIEDPDASLIVTGYTDSKSSAEYNMMLSKKRANSVLAYFTRLGIDASRFDIQFKGEEGLLINEGNALTQQLNRRVTLRVK